MLLYHQGLIMINYTFDCSIALISNSYIRKYLFLNSYSYDCIHKNLWIQITAYIFNSVSSNSFISLLILNISDYSQRWSDTRDMLYICFSLYLYFIFIYVYIYFKFRFIFVFFTIMNIKIKFYKVMAIHVLIYANLMWMLTAKEKQHIQTCKIKFLRNVMGYCLRDENIMMIYKCWIVYILLFSSKIEERKRQLLMM